MFEKGLKYEIFKTLNFMHMNSSATFHLISDVISNLRIHWRLSTILKTSNKSVWSNVFWYVKVYIFWKFIQYTIHWDKTQMLKKFPSDKINVRRNALSFFFAISNSRFYFNLAILIWAELKHKVYHPKIFRFWFRFVQQKAWTPWL